MRETIDDGWAAASLAEDLREADDAHEAFLADLRALVGELRGRIKWLRGEASSRSSLTPLEGQIAGAKANEDERWADRLEALLGKHGSERAALNDAGAVKEDDHG